MIKFYFHNEEAARYLRMNTDTVKIIAQFNLREIYLFRPSAL
jgi:hypothetical protein